MAFANQHLDRDLNQILPTIKMNHFLTKINHILPNGTCELAFVHWNWSYTPQVSPMSHHHYV
jgi:hypothetical protein